MGDEHGTLIKVGGKFFNDVSVLKTGTMVNVTGRFIPNGDDCFAETSLFVSGSMHSPDFLFRFDAVKPVIP